jgi:glucose-1-phosphate adenylyltransferase
MKDVMAVVLAGGKGSRLEPLTRDRAKPAVPFGGGYRIADFALSNCLNSGIRKVLLLTQYKASSLDRHVNCGWRQFFCRELGEFIDVVPPQQRIDEQWYQGTADAVYQNIYSIEKENPNSVLILAGDHIYKMNYGAMVEYHNQQQADLTVAALQVDPESAKAFGVMQVDDQNRIVGFEEKPASPKSIPGKPNECLASMGVYVFSARFLFEQLLKDANQVGSERDFGKNIIPSVIETNRVVAFPFRDENRKAKAYWRDVGTIDAYYEANMDLISVNPLLNMYDQQWPIRTFQENCPPPKFVFGTDNDQGRVGMATDSIVCPGSIVSGGRVERSVIGMHCRINSFSNVSDSILFDCVEVGRHAQVRRAIIDKGVKIPEGARIGFDLESDRRRGMTVTDSGIVVIGKGGVVGQMEDQIKKAERNIPAPHLHAKTQKQNR